jgi:competence protein ComEC
MVNSINRNPVLWAVLGAVPAYYALGALRSARQPWVTLAFSALAVLAAALAGARVIAAAPPAFFRTPAARNGFRGLTVSLTALALGFCLGFAARLAVPAVPAFGLPADQVTGLTGRLRDDPRAFADGRGMGYLDLSGAGGAGGIRTSAQGEVLVFYGEGAIPRLRSFGRGSRVYLEGRLLPGDDGSPETFRAAGVHILEAAAPLDQFRTGIRITLVEHLASEKWGGLALALLLGVRDNLDRDLSAAYQQAGCSHVLSLSGMHLAIISSVIAFLLRRPLGFRPAVILGALFIVIYGYLVGSQPSLERSALMYLLGAFALLGFLKREPLSLLGLAFLIQITLTPASGDSLSFILSYLALAGILLFSGPIRDLLRGILPDFITQPLAASLGAFLATAAVLAFVFGAVQPIGIIAGLVIVPLTTVFMIAAMAWLALVFLLPPLAALLAPLLGTALSFLYDGLNGVVRFAGRFGGVPVSRPWTALVLSVLAAAVLIAVWKRQTAVRNTCAPFA